MRTRLLLLASAPLLLGCAHVRVREAADKLERDCHAGDSLACLAAADLLTRTGDDPGRVLALEHSGCADATMLEPCHRDGLRPVDVDLGGPWPALEHACAHGFADACKLLSRRVARLMLERHPWVWGCLVGLDPELEFVDLWFHVQNRDDADAPKASVGVESTDLRLNGCLSDAIAATSFRPLRFGEDAAIHYRARLDPDHVARMLATARDAGSVVAAIELIAGPPLSSCPADTPTPCVTISAKDAERLDIARAPFDLDALVEAHGVAGPRTVLVTVDQCFGPAIEPARVVADGDDPAIAEILAATIRDWRMIVWKIDGKPVTACTTRRFLVDFRWRVR